MLRSEFSFIIALFENRWRSKCFIPALSYAPCSDGYNPVNIETCEGRVHGDGVIVFTYFTKPMSSRAAKPLE